MSKTYARSTLIENIRERFSWLEWKEGNLMKMLRKVIVLSHVRNIDITNIVEATYSEMTSFVESISKIEFTLIICIDQEQG
jgi:hypothetical protein